ncbi:pollen receptor-like kinase 4 [Beta vulgaris subsp. vulgaris]|uniref:pollen receptor-like kinase 4 n=1 Tax=Beta vulgaris subsp. vulgaris TaxID=3555 RepID=UPI0020368E0F|nr:pollen receptor-like kinase 4 [Beta vulgaris subsp. vulgaris]
MGAHASASPVRPPPSTSCFLVFLIISLLAITHIGTPVSGVTEAEALLKFKSSLTNQEAIPNWDPSTTPCSNGGTSKWVGVICEYGKVWGLQLQNMGLGGTPDIDALYQLSELRTLSFKNNKLEGPIPDLHRLPKLRSLFLTNNKFSGEIPEYVFAGMDSLRRVVLTNNAFTGKIPSSLATLPILVELKLDRNQFQGNIPDFQQKNLPSINVANNQLEGPLPARLTKLDAKLYSGNKGLCGAPLEPCASETAASAPTPITKHKSSSKTAIIVVDILLGLVILIVVILLVCQKKRRAKFMKQNTLASQDGNQFVETYVPPSEQRTMTTRKRSDPEKLDFVRDDRKNFDLSDLLTASAEVLESGNFESSYKVEIIAGELLVVKRFRQMSKVGREDFHEHSRIMGKLRHPNVLALVAYYYRKEEKLLIFDFVDNGSLASHLHGNRSQKDRGFDWPMRLKIIKGVARGLAYLYSELPSYIVPHGYLKSSNVLLNDSYEPLLMNYALQPLINPEHAKQLMVAYKSPEYAQLGRLTRKTDVWSLGILILEVLTGKFPTNFLAVGTVKGENLVAWVHDIASAEEKGEDVFDKEMGGTHHSQDEIKKLLKVGFSCCHENLDVRWSIKEAVEKIEEIKETNKLN